MTMILHSHSPLIFNPFILISIFLHYFLISMISSMTHSTLILMLIKFNWQLIKISALIIPFTVIAITALNP